MNYVYRINVKRSKSLTLSEIIAVLSSHFQFFLKKSFSTQKQNLQNKKKFLCNLLQHYFNEKSQLSLSYKNF